MTNEALILDIKIADLRREGDALVRRPGDVPLTKKQQARYDEIYDQTLDLVIERWHMIPPHLRAWCAAKANAGNGKMKRWRAKHQVRVGT